MSQEVVNKLIALRKRLDERSDFRPSFSLIFNPGQVYVAHCSAVPNQEAAVQEFFALTKQIEPLLIKLGAPIAKSGSVLEWANEAVINSREVIPSWEDDKTVEILTPCDHPYRMLAIAIDMFLATKAHSQTPKEAAGKWMYELAMKGTAWGTIRRRLKKNPKTWPSYDTDNGVKKAVFRYAEDHNLPPPPPRKSGRPRGKRNTN